MACVLLLTTPSIVYSQDVFTFRLNTQAFSSTMCKKIRPDENLRLQIAHHRDLMLRKVPNQFMPRDFEEARKKPYVHFLTLQDLTNGVIHQGAIAFNEQHAVIFTEDHPKGISREEFVSHMPRKQRLVANTALNTFLRLHPILNAAVDGCRPYPSHVTYGTDDEIDKIEAGKLAYRDLAKHYNANPYPDKDLFRFERGTSGGFYDPRTQGRRVSYLAANPLHFYQSASTSP
jgi:hypothetical protein